MEEKGMDFLSRARWLLLSGLRAIQQLTGVRETNWPSEFVTVSVCKPRYTGRMRDDIRSGCPILE